MNYAQKLIDAAAETATKKRLKQIRESMPWWWWEKQARRLELKLIYGADYEEDEAP
jgi:hypothetical protein